MSTMWTGGQCQTCSELLEEPHAGAEELVGGAEVAEVGPAEGQEQPQQGQVSLQHGLRQGCSDDQVACKAHTVLLCVPQPRCGHSS